MTHDILLEKILAARSDIAEAERALDDVIREIQVASRAEKTTVGAGVEAAFGKLRAALARHVELEALLAELEP